MQNQGVGRKAEQDLSEGWVFALLAASVLAAYFGAFRNYFINDDFLHLDFIQSFRGSYLEFFLPHLRPSDVVTGARYEPLHVIFYALLYPVFGMFFPAYQALHLVLHTLNAWLIFRIGRHLGIQSSGALLGALFFCVYRLNSQAVLWYSSLFCTAAAGLMLGAFLALMRPGFRHQAVSAGLFFAASLMSLRAPQYLLLAAAWLWIYRKPLTDGGLLKEKFAAGLAAAAAAGLSGAANVISWRHFPNDLPPPEIDLFAIPAFLMNLVFPYEAPWFLKAAAVALTAALAAFRWKDAAVRFLVCAALLNSVFWFLLISCSHLPYAPRYLYLGSVFYCLLMGHILGSALRGGRGLQRILAGLLAAGFLLGNMVLTVRQDTVWFRYLSVRGEKLTALAAEPGAERKRLKLEGDFFEDDPNLNFFRGRLEFVSPEQADQAGVFAVDLEREKYQRILRRDIGKDYWFQPWFIKRPCRDDSPWC
ncbi:MAG: hypothetical protein FGM27_04925 [Candidatus Omnitrophica bacterium]|nr:hypothetical protein [Candidatus Omnitrophota bacterium]